MEMKMKMEKLAQKSVKQGVDYLRSTASGTEIMFGINGGFNMLKAENSEAKAFSNALDENIGHSGASFGFAFKAALQEATDKSIVQVVYLDNDGRAVVYRNYLSPNMKRIRITRL
jgi:hypothetical protein